MSALDMRWHTAPALAPRAATRSANAAAQPVPAAADAVPLGVLLQRAGAAVRTGVPEATWVVAAVVTVKPARGGFSLELTEPEVAPASAGLLRCYLPDGTVAALRQRTGLAVVAENLTGMTIVAQVSVELSPRWGLSGRVHALGPGIEASLAQRALEASIVRLQREGLFDRQRRLRPPTDITRVAIVHPANAAGWADVQSELVRWEAAGLIAVRSSPTAFEGADAATGIAAALRRAAEPLAGHAPDVLLLVRGGGAALSLSSLDSEDLARAIAACPVRVITGLGHASDGQTLADRVSWRSADTPSKALGLLRDHLTAPARRARTDYAAITASLSVGLDRTTPSLHALERRVSAQSLRQAVAVSETLDLIWAAVRAATEAARERLVRQDDGLERLANDIAIASPALVAHTASGLDAAMEAVRAGARRASAGAPDGAHLVSAAASARAEALMASAEADLANAGRAVPVAARALADRSAAEGNALLAAVQRRVRDRLGQADDGSHHLVVVRTAAADTHAVRHAAAERLQQTIETAVSRRIDAAAADLDRISAVLDAADPVEVLNLGFALAMDRHDRPITSAAAAEAASTFVLRFTDGSILVRSMMSNPKPGDSL